MSCSMYALGEGRHRGRIRCGVALVRAKLIATVEAPEADAAIKVAAEEYKVSDCAGSLR